MNAVPEDAAASLQLERVYVWQLPVRLVHWLLFFSIVILAATGYYLGNPFISVPGPAREHLLMASVRVVHLYASIVFTLSALVRVYWAFAGNSYARWPDFVPVSMRRLQNFKKSLLFYTFLSREPDEYLGHNAVAALTYLLIFVVYFIMIATGLALYIVYAPLNSPMRVFTFLIPIFHGLQDARLIHHIGMWVILVFAVVHVYFVVLYSIVEHIGIFDSIFSGFKFQASRKSAQS